MKLSKINALQATIIDVYPEHRKVVKKAVADGVCYFVASRGTDGQYYVHMGIPGYFVEMLSIPKKRWEDNEFELLWIEE